MSNVHDLFEILSSIATVIAVGLAFMGVNAWRRQVAGEADHELARRVSVALLKYKNSALESFLDAHFSVLQSPVGGDRLPPDIVAQVVEGMKAKLKNREEEKAGFLAVLLEVKAIWGGGCFKGI